VRDYCSGFYSDRHLPCKRLQVDEIWAFVYAKQKNISTAKKDPPQAGDAWVWTAIDADTKLVPSWLVGDRSGETAQVFKDDLAKRLANRVQLTRMDTKPISEGLKARLVPT
jgi:hypothetical protein